MNALYRQVPRLSREAEIITGVVNLEVDIGDDMASVAQTELTGNFDHVNHAAATAGRNIGYVTGKLSKKVDEARALYMQFAKQHIAYIKQNNRMQRAIRSGDFDTQLDAGARMDKLVASMKRTVAEFRPLAKEVAHLDREFDKAIKHGAEGMLKQGAAGGLGGISGEDLVTEKAGDVAGYVYGKTLEGGTTKAYEWAAGSSDSD